jgi:hypothetical protein
MATVRSYNVVGGRAKVQIEDMLGTNPGGGWVYQRPGAGNNPGAEGAHYYYRSQTQQGSHKTAPDNGRFTFKLNVAEAGQYEILLRASRDDATPGDARNDIWIRVDGNTQSVMPKGSPQLTSGGEGFVKYKSGPPAHKWINAHIFSTDRHGDNNAPSTVVFDKGTHTITFAPRSTGYHIDSVQVIKKGLSANALDLDLDATPVTEAEPDDHSVGVARSAITIGIEGKHDDFESNKAAASDDLEFGRDGAGAQSVGLRFEAADIDKDAEIKSAYFVFQAAETSKGAAHFKIEVEDSTDAKTYSKADAPDDRAYLAEEVDWHVAAWKAGETYKSADIAELIEAVIEAGGAEALEALGFRISGSGERVAAAFESDGQAPELVIAYA